MILPLRLWTDSTASKGICSRQGLGKIRHLDTQDLWVQQRLRNGDFSLHKIDGERNPGDLFTKGSLTRVRIKGLLELLGCQLRSGRPEAAPALRQKGGEAKVFRTEKPRWSEEEEEDFSRIHSDTEVIKMLKREGLPHHSAARHPSEEPKPAYPEVEEAVDPVAVEGEALGREGGGRGGLAVKLQRSPASSKGAQRNERAPLSCPYQVTGVLSTEPVCATPAPLSELQRRDSLSLSR